MNWNFIDREILWENLFYRLTEHLGFSQPNHYRTKSSFETLDNRRQSIRPKNGPKFTVPQEKIYLTSLVHILDFRIQMSCYISFLQMTTLLKFLGIKNPLIRLTFLKHLIIEVPGFRILSKYISSWVIDAWILFFKSIDISFYR